MAIGLIINNQIFIHKLLLINLNIVVSLFHRMALVGEMNTVEKNNSVCRNAFDNITKILLNA